MEAHAAHAHHEMPTEGNALTGVAVSATLHCLTGCAIGEVSGVAIGTALGFSDLGTIALAIGLAFAFGYALTSLPLLRAGLALGAVIPIALASDTLSIATMEVVDNAILLIIPGAMDAGLNTVLFWGSLAFALAIAFVLTVPVNRWLLARGKGHTAVHNTGIHGGPPTRLVGVAVVLAFIFGSSVLVAEAFSEDEMGQEVSASAEIDGAFVTEMVPHHESAIEMAKIAQRRAEHPQISELADNIVATQSAEIDRLNQIGTRLNTGDGAHGSLGLDQAAMGMEMGGAQLETAKPFDRSFIDAMIPHHQGAIRMAQVALADGGDQETEALANEIIAAQSREITKMNGWRTDWYGSPSPAGGIPAAEFAAPESSSEMSGMEH